MSKKIEELESALAKANERLARYERDERNRQLADQSARQAQYLTRKNEELAKIRRGELTAEQVGRLATSVQKDSGGIRIQLDAKWGEEARIEILKAIEAESMKGPRGGRVTGGFASGGIASGGHVQLSESDKQVFQVLSPGNAFTLGYN